MNPTLLQRISDHVYWMPPAKPDRPSLCAVVGTEKVLLLDAGASDLHARQFLEQLKAQGVSPPTYVALTHWHWDHVFGAAEIGVPIIAHTATAEMLSELSRRDWSDAGLERQIALGQQTVRGAADIRAELPAPRIVRIAQPSLLFQGSLEIKLGGVTCEIRHVGGDHAADSSVVQVAPDGVLFLGDCLCETVYSQPPHYTAPKLLRLLATLQTFAADHYVAGHEPKVATRAEFAAQAAKIRYAAKLVEIMGATKATIEMTAPEPLDEDTAYYLNGLIAGLTAEA